ncbi:MAG TPA: efflux RND transporter permease subunit [bacterium]|nr:efflux RND transporter permease subunit [bacterium]
MWLTRLALRNPVLILMMSLMAVALGWVSLTHLAVDLFPQIDLPVVRVTTFYTGAGPGDIEKTITQPLERAAAAAPGVDRVESVSKQGTSVITVYFNYGTNLDNAQFEVSQRINRVVSTLPPGIQAPVVFKFDISNIPVVNIAVASSELDERQLFDLAFNTVEPQLERLKGVASATVSGGQTRQINVMADADGLRARNLDVLDLVNAVRTANLLLPSGSLKAGSRNYNVFANTQVDTATRLQDLVVRPPTGGIGPDFQAPVRVRDVADVVDSIADQDEIVRINGRRGVNIRVNKQPGANTIAVVDGINAAIPKMIGVPENVHLDVAFDQSHYIRSAVGALEHEAVQGGLLAVVVILIFLVSLRATAIVSVAIPLSIISTFVLLYFTGQTLNVFTLGGLALGVGRLVDDSIVELENIHRHLEKGQERKNAVLAAAQEVAMPILVSTITTIVVFFPVLFLTGVARNLFYPLALTIAFALIMSFFVSRTVTPLLCYYWMKAGHPAEGSVPARIGAWLEKMDDAYAGILRRVLRHRWMTVGVILGLFAASLLLGRRIGTEFFPQTDESQFGAVYKAPIGTRVERTELIAEALEERVRETLKGPDGKPDYGTVITDSGLPSGLSATFSQNLGSYSGTLQVNLVSPQERKYTDQQATEIMRKALGERFPGISIFFSSGGIVSRILNFGSAAPIDIEVLGYDLDTGGDYAKKLAAALRKELDPSGQPYVTDVQISREENYPELDVQVDRQKAGMAGVSEEKVAQALLTSLVGNTQFAPVPFTDPRTGNEYFINVRLKDPDRSHVGDIPSIFLRTTTNRIVPLANVATVTRGSGPVTINRKYLQRIVDVTGNVPPWADLGSSADAARRVMAQFPPPEGFTVHLGGQAEAQAQAFAGLKFAALLALALVYMVLASQFKSLIDPLVIMFSVPLGITGVFVMLYVTGTTLSVNSFMGIIMMVGIVVSNGVLLVDFANVLRRRDGLDLFEATVRAGRTRLRPILMTTLATIVGLIPMAAGIGEGSETNLPLARAVIGGLTVSTFFTLFLIPCLYTLLDSWARKLDPEVEGEGDEQGGAPTPAPGAPAHA